MRSNHPSFRSRNPVLWAESETMALPQISIIDVECWSNGVWDCAHKAQGTNFFFNLPGSTDPSFNSSPVLQHSNTPTPCHLRGGFWPPSRGFQTKPRPLGVDSLLQEICQCLRQVGELKLKALFQEFLGDCPLSLQEDRSKLTHKQPDKEARHGGHKGWPFQRLTQ